MKKTQTRKIYLNHINKIKTSHIKKTRKRRTRSRKDVYSQDEYNSGDGMLTTVWGPPMWHYLHTMSFNYPVEPTEEEKRDYMNFVLSLQNVLPCKYCRINLKTNFKQLPLTMVAMKSRDSFSRYIYNLHELVNKMLHKKSNLTYKMVRNKYENYRARCLNKTKKEHGCTNPLKGKKYKCKLNIVPLHSKTAKII